MENVLSERSTGKMTEERKPEVEEVVGSLERKIDQGGELMHEIIVRIGVVLAPDVPEPVDATAPKVRSRPFNSPLAQHLEMLRDKLGATIDLGKNLLHRIEL